MKLIIALCLVAWASLAGAATEKIETVTYLSVSDLYQLSFSDGDNLVVYSLDKFQSNVWKERITFSSDKLAAREYWNQNFGAYTHSYPDQFEIRANVWYQALPPASIRKVPKNYRAALKKARRLARERWPKIPK